MIKKFGFTLAEVLITLAVIGIISALTIPNLVNNYNKKAQAASAHKFVSQFEDAIGAYIIENNADNLYEAGIGSTDTFKGFFQKYFKIITDCGGNTTPCFSNLYTSIDGTDSKNTVAEGCTGGFTLASGTSVCVSSGLNYSYTYDGKTNKYGFLYFDTNGIQPPNIAGRDLFVAYIFEDGTLESNTKATPMCRKYNNSEACGGYASYSAARKAGSCLSDAWPGGCLSRLMDNNWIMDY